MEIVSSNQSDSGALQRYVLSEEAKIILKAAASNNDGSILKLSYLGGRVIQAGGQSFGRERGHEAAKWEDALGELENQSLIIGRGYKGEVFELTHEGWAVVDLLEQRA